MKYQENYCFADLAVSISHSYSYLSHQCKDYLTDREPIAHLEITPDDVKREQERAEFPDSPLPYLESLACYRKFCEWAVWKDVLLFHSSTVAVDGVAYLFAAPSGTGKSTHTALWRKMLGERAVMINDDKPLISLADGKARVYGTPWDGKHRLSVNTSAPIAGICFLSRGAENTIQKASPNEVFPLLISQTFRPGAADGTQKMLQLAISLAGRVPLWSLACNMQDEAAQLSYQAMQKEYWK